MMTNARDTLFDRVALARRALDHALGADQEPTSSGGSARNQLWLPPVDVYETDTSYVIEADLPGVHLENVDISFEQNTLTITGTRAPTLQAPEKGELRVYTAERASGNFTRSVRLPEYVEGEKIQASYADGVLHVTVPKAESAKPRKIAIRGAGEAKQLNR